MALELESNNTIQESNKISFAINNEQYHASRNVYPKISLVTKSNDTDIFSRSSYNNDPRFTYSIKIEYESKVVNIETGIDSSNKAVAELIINKISKLPQPTKNDPKVFATFINKQQKKREFFFGDLSVSVTEKTNQLSR